MSARDDGGEQAHGKPGGAGAGHEHPGRCQIHDFTMEREGTAADRDAAASIMKEMPHSALSGSGGIGREKERR